ncbi:hypothetical protein AAG570_013247 [Ranatra chinensis]|uniref:Uncharacterized protein n=1 Tax=Ranatra chinensis TaxID=642074 RepID=A0ABD0YI77_9HEMI
MRGLNHRAPVGRIRTDIENQGHQPGVLLGGARSTSTPKCNRPPRCVPCGGGHESSTCLKTRETPATCALCGGDHPANYKSCQAYKELQERSRPGQPRRDVSSGRARSVAAVPTPMHVVDAPPKVHQPPQRASPATSSLGLRPLHPPKATPTRPSSIKKVKPPKTPPNSPPKSHPHRAKLPPEYLPVQPLPRGLPGLNAETLFPNRPLRPHTPTHSIQSSSLNS